MISQCPSDVCGLCQGPMSYSYSPQFFLSRTQLWSPHLHPEGWQHWSLARFTPLGLPVLMSMVTTGWLCILCLEYLQKSCRRYTLIICITYIYIHIHTHTISISCMYNSLFHLSYCQGTSPNIMFWTQQTEQRHLRPSVTPSDVEWHPQAPHLKPGEEHKETMGRVEVSVVTHVVILSHPESSWVILSHPESSWVILYGMYLFPFILWMYLSSHLLLISEINQTHTIHTVYTVWSTVPKRPVEAFVPPQDPLDEIKPKCLSSCQDWLPAGSDLTLAESHNRSFVEALPRSR